MVFETLDSSFFVGEWDWFSPALRTSFPLLDVDIDRKKLGAKMGLHEHFLGEAHAIH